MVVVVVLLNQRTLLGHCCSGGGGWEMETMVRSHGVDEGDDGVDVVVAWFRWRWWCRQWVGDVVDMMLVGDEGDVDGWMVVDLVADGLAEKI
nr:hypothetical protein [Tanacetum cinerariifolium]